MQKILFVVGSFLLVSGCSTLQNEKVAQEKTSVQNRLPATHVYGGSSCSNSQFDLKYDGPGSNYAFGGLSNLYVKDQKNSEAEPVKLLAYEDRTGSPLTIGEQYDDSSGPLHLNFSQESSKRVGKVQLKPKVGDSCTPGELAYQHAAWTTSVVIKIEKISSEASRVAGLKNGSRLSLRCSESSDIPVTCPQSGRYGRKDLNN